MTSLFDKKERSPLSTITFIIFIIILMALNNNEKIIDIPYLYILFRLIQIIFSAYIIYKGVFLVKGSFKELQKRKLTEKLQILFVILFLILIVFVTTENMIHTTKYIEMNIL